MLGAVPDPLQVSGEFVRAHRLARRDRHRPGKDLRCVLKDVPGKSRVDHPRILYVVPRKYRRAEKYEEKNDAKQGQPKLRRPKSFLNADSQNGSSRLKLHFLLIRMPVGSWSLPPHVVSGRAPSRFRSANGFPRSAKNAA